MSRLAYLVALCAASLCFTLGSTQTTPSPEEELQRKICNSMMSCEQCVANLNNSLPNAGLCAWCANPSNASSSNCLPVSSTLLFNALKECPNLQYNFGTCALTVLVILILILLAIFLFFCCCCSVLICCCVACSKCRKRRDDLDQENYFREKDEISRRSAERRADRKVKHDEIRRKYGLGTDDGADGKYRRFD